MGNDELIRCKACGTLSIPDARYCQNCGAGLALSADRSRRVNVVDASGGGNVSSNDPQASGAARVNVVDASGHGTVAMGQGATAVGPGGVNIGKQVIIENQVVNTAGPISRFDIPNDTIFNSSLFPQCAAELDRSIRIGDRAVIGGALFTARDLIAGDQVTLRGPVFARAGMVVGQKCQLLGRVCSGGPIRVKPRTQIAAVLTSTTQDGVDIGANCQADGILTGGDVVIGADVMLTWIHTRADVALGPRSTADRIVGRNVTVGAGARACQVIASGDLYLEPEAVVDRCSVGRKLHHAPTAEIRLMDTVLHLGPLPPNSFPLRLADQTMTEENAVVYLRDKGQLLPYGEVRLLATDAVVIISRHLTAKLAKTIRSVARPYFTLEQPEP